MRPTTPLAIAIAALAAAPFARAQWPTNPATNLPIGAANGEQTLAKVAVTADGGCYVGWFDNRSGSYAVYAQRFDAAGNEQWAPGGLLVSGNPQSTSLVDWDLIADSLGGCVLTFTDTRAGGDLHVYPYRLLADGTFLWGANGVALSNNGDYEPNPRVVEASDGSFVFVWPQTGIGGLQLQRLDAAGTPQFAGDGMTIPGDPGATPAFASLVAAQNGEVIVSWVRTISFSGTKHVHAQKFDAAGSALWNGGTRIAVFDQASVPTAHQPKMIGDGAGGAFCSWHFAVGQQFSARVQHLLANGSEAWAHNGLDVSASAGSKFDPAIAFATATQRLQVAWNERNLAQSMWGISAQSLDLAGNAQWGANGTTLLPIDNVTKFAPVAAPLGDGLAVAVLVESLGALNDEVRVFAVDAAGTVAWSTAASTFASDKLRLALATTPSGSSVLAWTDNRAAGSDVYGQALDLGGAVGLQLATAVDYGCGGNPAGSFAATTRPAFGGNVHFELRNPVGSQAVGTHGFVCFGVQALPGFPCGVAVPGFGMGGPGQPGELLLDITQSTAAAYAGLWPGGNGVVPFDFAIPFAASLAGAQVYAQGLMIDFTPAAPVPFALTTAVRLTVGS